jgi:sialate O-acetylesterase
MKPTRPLARLWTQPALGLALALISAGGATAEVSLPSLFSDHMVLQQGLPVPVWGWAAPGERRRGPLAGQAGPPDRAAGAARARPAG